ncbi:unnamed protein product [Miscanthus lutarioriparius]|uniref:Formation of crista junctions protein 1 n=1 Tax=Miscanthus lutarioriparius TaxID=422564 RepID=A0A811QVS8_9POAL|nr:unnamed protein product [Miscanthus lutarioriparius]
MLRRCMRDLRPLRSLARVPRPISGESPTFLKSRSNSTKASPKSSTQNAAPGPRGQPSQSGSNVSKLVLGTLVVGAAAMGAHQLGYIDLQFKDKKLPFSLKKEDAVNVYEDLKVPSEQKVDQTQNVSGPNTEIVQEGNNEANTPKDVRNDGVGAPEVPTNGDQPVPAEEKKSETLSHETHPVPDEHGSDTKMPSEDSPAVELKTVPIDDNESGEVPHEQQTDKIDSTVPPVQSTPTTVSTYDHPTDPDGPKDLTGAVAVEQKSLAETYLLQDEPDVSKDATIKEKRSDEVVREKTSEDGKIVLDIIEAIHAAEKKQADVDAYMYSEERRKLKEKYEKELKDTRARELMYAEEAAILDKELKKEKLKNAAAIKELQEKAEQKLQDELQRKDEETSQQVEKAQEIAKAELAAAIAKEKASQIEQIAEANLNFNSLKETIRHFSLLPAGGGGILAHAVARVASSIKIKGDNSGDGIESLINKVESLIVDGDLSAAADALEQGLHGTEAEEIATEWVKQARKRAIAEQTLALLHACASSTTFS